MSVRSRIGDRIGGRSDLLAWVRGLVSVGLLLFLLGQLDLGRAFAIIADARPGLVAMVLALPLADRFLAAYRLYVLLADRTATVAFPGVLRLIFVSAFVGTFLPGGVGVEVVRAYGLARTTSDNALAVSAILVERGLALFALVAFVVVGLAVLPAGLPAGIAPAAWIVFLGLLAGAGAALSPPVRGLGYWLLPGRALARARDFLARIYACLDAYKRTPGRLAWATGLAFVFQFVRIVTAAAAAAALGLDIGFLELTVIVPVVVLVGLMPISIAGIGVQEVAFVYLLGTAGVGNEAALAFSVLVRAATFVSLIPGAWLFLRRGLHER